MLSSIKLKRLCETRKTGISELAGQLARSGLDAKEARSAIRNWQRGLFKPVPRRDDIRNLAAGLSSEVNDLLQWQSICRYAPMSSRKVRLVTQLIQGRDVQDALDVLKFSRNRAARMVEKVLKAAIADADEQEGDVENLFVSEARAEDAGIRIGTKRWIPKDRGRTHPIGSKASHIYVSVSEL